MLRTGVIWKSGWVGWVTSRSGWLLELLTELIMLKIKIEESHYERLFLKLWCQTKIERRAQRSSKTCEICIRLPQSLGFGKHLGNFLSGSGAQLFSPLVDRRLARKIWPVFWGRPSHFMLTLESTDWKRVAAPQTWYLLSLYSIELVAFLYNFEPTLFGTSAKDHSDLCYYLVLMP